VEELAISLMRPWTFRRCLLRVLAAALLLVAFAPASARATEVVFGGLGSEFPVSPAMAERVRFWIRVFTEIGDDEVLLHDRDDLRLVYDTVPLGPARHEDPIESARSSYDRLLTSVALADLRPKLLTPGAPVRRHIEDLFARHGLGPRAAARAIGNIRAQRGLRDTFALGLARGELYLPKIRRVFREEKVPAVLAYLPHVESSFNPNAVSRSGAVGIWQLTAATAESHLVVRGGRDDRFDPERSSRAAARHLLRAHSVLGSWPLAITAYNHGVAGVVRARGAVGPNIDDIVRGYESPSFGFASRNFYAEFLAAAHVARHAARYFPGLELKPFLEYHVRRGDSLWTIARKHRVSVRTLMAVNSLGGTKLREGQRLVIRLS
jgi:membrane-bound lytic murein transglycosylase D